MSAWLIVLIVAIVVLIIALIAKAAGGKKGGAIMATGQKPMPEPGPSASAPSGGAEDQSGDNV
ncbi:MAG: hypothetical protein M1127_02910 [Patescibacteria group bacterium]|nr:hypothetical protein [Patescibacteria group bacterium]